MGRKRTATVEMVGIIVLTMVTTAAAVRNIALETATIAPAIIMAEVVIATVEILRNLEIVRDEIPTPASALEIIVPGTETPPEEITHRAISR